MTKFSLTTSIIVQVEDGKQIGDHEIDDIADRLVRSIAESFHGFPNVIYPKAVGYQIVEDNAGIWTCAKCSQLFSCISVANSNSGFPLGRVVDGVSICDSCECHSAH